MTIDEAIALFKERAQNSRDSVGYLRHQNYSTKVFTPEEIETEIKEFDEACLEDAKEDEQIASWLEELKRYKALEENQNEN